MIKGTTEVPSGTLDELTLENLKFHHQLCKEFLDDYYNEKAWLHRDDLEDLSVMIHHLKAVIVYYGGSVE